jgi:hypothetical protein
LRLYRPPKGIESENWANGKDLLTYGNGGDVGQIGSDTGGVDDIVEGKLVNQRRGLQQEREGLDDRNG